MHCGSCGAPLWPGSAVCAGCGAAVAPTESAPAITVLGPVYGPPPVPGSSRGLQIAIAACSAIAAVTLALIVGTHTPARHVSISQPTIDELPTFPVDTDLPSLPALIDPVAPSSSVSINPHDFAASSLTHVWHLTEAADSGGYLGITFGVSAPETATSGRTVGAGKGRLTLATSCDHINPSADAVLAVQVVIHNPTKQAMPVGYVFNVSGPKGADAIEIADSTGTRCKVGLDATAVDMAWTDTMPAGSDRVSNMFFVFHGYYTEPTVDRQARLETTRFSFSYASGQRPSGSETTFTPGPLVGPDVDYGFNDSAPLSG